MQQIVDLEADESFTALGVEILSIAFDPADVQTRAGAEFGVETTPLLVDGDQSVSETYDVLKWAVATGEPGHTFILVDGDGELAWIRDYRAPENGGLMYVPVPDLANQIAAALGG